MPEKISTGKDEKQTCPGPSGELHRKADATGRHEGSKTTKNTKDKPRTNQKKPNRGLRKDMQDRVLDHHPIVFNTPIAIRLKLLTAEKESRNVDRRIM